jgi:hypothetical protein
MINFGASNRAIIRSGHRKSIMLSLHLRKIFILASVAVLILLNACRKDNFNDDPNFRLEFSADTVIFDTVFSTVGSVTLPLKVYNRSSAPVRISSIALAGANNSNFRMNVDGYASDLVQDIEIDAKDSIFILVEVTVDPGNVNNPFIITDSIEFITNGHWQKVSLVAWGQDAHFYYPDHYSPNLPPYSLVSGNWYNDKPHVIYGYAVVDENTKLTIHPGTQVYMHNDAVLWVYDGGTLAINGSVSDKVTIQGDRLEQAYKDLPGQWGKIWLSAGSFDNVIQHAVIRNGSIGIQADTVMNTGNPTVLLINTKIENMSVAGLYARGAWVIGWNNVFTNCGQYAMVLSLGGSYNFRHCSIGNYWTYSVRQTPSLVLNNYYKDVNNNIQIRDLSYAYFGNCIIHGSIADEIFLDSAATGGIFSYEFRNCIVKTERNLGSFPKFIDCMKNPASELFVDKSKNDLHLSTSSPAIDFGSSAVGNGQPFDIEGNARVYGTAPDAGAYEWSPAK